VRRKGKRVSLIVSRATSDERERAMSEEAELASPAAAIVAKKEINQTGNGAPDIVCI
jgi:hypothetical protein